MLKSVKNKMDYLSVVLVIIFFILFEIPASGAMKDWQIKFSNNELAADIQEAPLGVILEEIHKKEGIEFFLDQGEFERIITVKFGFLPLERALARIIGKLNYAILFGADDKILGVTIIGTNWTFPLEYRMPSPEDQFLREKIDAGNLSEERAEDRVRAKGHEMVVKPTSIVNEMPIEPSNRRAMEITTVSNTDMTVTDSPSMDGVEISPPSTTMVLEPPRKRKSFRLGIQQDADGGALEVPAKYKTR